MKRKSIAVFVLVLVMLAFTACSTSTFSLDGIDEKRMTISAENAEKDDFLSGGGLVVREGERIVMTADLSEGSIRVEILEATGEDGENAPDLSSEPILMGNLERTDSASGGMPAGEYVVKATCLEKATGTVVVEVLPAE